MVALIKKLLRQLVYHSWMGRMAWRCWRNLMARVWRWRLPQGTYVDMTAQVLGWQQLRIGRNTVIGQHTWINVNHRVPGQVAMKIGNHCFIGRDNFFSTGTRIVVGDYVLTTKDCKFVSAAHVYDDPCRAYIATGTTSSDSIIVGANCFFGIGAMVVGDVCVGHGSVIGAGAVVRASVPPFSLVVGNPGKVVKRYDFHVRQWVRAEAFNADDAIPSEEDYLAMLQRADPHPDLPVIAASRREGEL